LAALARSREPREGARQPLVRPLSVATESGPTREPQEGAEGRPLVLFLDDLHWADPASLDLLRFLARQVGGLPVLLLVTSRDDELPRRHPLYPLLPALVREAHARRLDVRPLDEEAVLALARARYRLAEPDEGRLV